MDREDIRYICVPVAEVRIQPNKHIVYGIQVQGPVRSWTVWHRYQEFHNLDAEFQRMFPQSRTPTTLPPKSMSASPWDILKACGGTGFEWIGAGIRQFGSRESNSNINTEQNTQNQHRLETEYLKTDGEVTAANQIDEGWDKEFVEKRRQGLEEYLQGILTSKDSKWRETKQWQDFLLPPRNTTKKTYSPETVLTTRIEGRIKMEGREWIMEFRKAEQGIIDIRQLLERRENALAKNDISTSHQSMFQAKRKLSELGSLLETLERGLLEQEDHSLFGAALEPQTVTRGEILRRKDKIYMLIEEKNAIERVIKGSSGQQTRGRGSGIGAPATSRSDADKEALMEGKSEKVKIIGKAGIFGALSGAMNQIPFGVFSPRSGSPREQRPETEERESSGKKLPDNNDAVQAQHRQRQQEPQIGVIKGANRRRNRGFGKFAAENEGRPHAEETERTRGLDNTQLLEMQNKAMEDQDSRLKDFAQILKRQKEIGHAIGQELEVHNQLLDDLGQDVELTGGKMALARQNANKIK
ncbi:putative syntaxin-8B [Zancudomyces culisetae]|uniref:Putative syntaxin-8B n=1 Tax=Zancudomyces culisetae TaxID=1213189 RepID=A0A1R1PNL1_ZANCU|nr:putative syntaxin-8B [Zancudomyces culisetae]|eukprot:OMH82549.1 putative syntaxin-8B [Zancudomyces culisetae]